MQVIESQYSKLLASFLKKRDTASLEEPRALGKELLKRLREPSEIINLHREALRQSSTVPGAISAEEYDLSLAFLAEVLRSYGLDPLRPLLEATVTSRFVAQVLRELESQSAIADVGRLRIGRRYADNIQGDLDNCLQIFQMQGLGALRIVAVSEEKGEIAIEGEDLFESVDKGSYPQDHFTRGFLAAVVTRLVGQKMNCEETTCQAKGDAVCRFVVSPVDSGPIENMKEKLSRVQ